jgi:hypothetical protein
MDKSNNIINFLMESFIIDNLELSNPIFFNKSINNIHKKIRNIKLEQLSSMDDLNKKYTLYKL